MATELVYVILPVHSRGQYDTREYFRNCVKTMQEHTSNFIPVFVDDFCDADGSAVVAEVASQYPNGYLIKTFKQRWFTRAVNLGLRLVRTPWCVAVNSDVVFGPGWLEELMAVRDDIAAQGRKVGLVGSVLSEEEGRRYDETSYPNYVTGHAWLLNMQALYECSVTRDMPGWYLDEKQQQTIHIRSDNEISHCMNKLGWATARSFKSAVGHHGGKSWHHDLGRVQNLKLADVNDY